MKKKRSKKPMVGIIAGIVALAFLWVGFCGWLWGWGPFSKLHNLKTRADSSGFGR